MNKLQQAWRWYGPNDPVSLDDIKQAGATAIVTALHHIPHGEIWPLEDIQERKAIIEKAGLTWAVVESVPVHEEIKTAGTKLKHYLDNYNQTLSNLAQCDIKIVCYNFMPVLDWTRTMLDLKLENGAKTLYFDWIDLAVFDIYILKRVQAEIDYSDRILSEAKVRYSRYNQSELDNLEKVVLMGIPGEENITLSNLQQSIDTYAKIGKNGLRDNLTFFLNAISSTCESNGIKMTIHPDDPPYPILGLPRIVSCGNDIQYILDKVDTPFNGVCFCTGSLGASLTNNLPNILNSIKERVYFAHLRNVKKDEIGSFYEADHLDGDVDMYHIMKILVEENQHRDSPIPFRPDHGHQMLDDLNKITNPGYSAIGRLKGLAELRGLEYGIIANHINR